MPVFQFNFGPPTAGCVAKVVVKTPWNKPVMHQSTGRVLKPVEAAFQWLHDFGAQPTQYGGPTLAFPPQEQSQGAQLGNEDGQAQILVLELYQPTADRQPVNAPYGNPVGNGRQLTMPPLPSKERTVPQGYYEPIHDCGLAANDDPLLGGGDPEGGTFTDLDSMGNETVRQLAMPPSPKVYDR